MPSQAAYSMPNVQTNNTSQSKAINIQQSQREQLNPFHKLQTLKLKSKTAFDKKFRNYFTLQIELKRCKPSAKIASAYIDSNETLILKYSNPEEKDISANNWPEAAFNTGIELMIKTQKLC